MKIEDGLRIMRECMKPGSHNRCDDCPLNKTVIQMFRRPKTICDVLGGLEMEFRELPQEKVK